MKISAKSIVKLLTMIAAIPGLAIGFSGVIYELFGSSGYDKFLNLLHVHLTLGQLQLIGLISFLTAGLLFLLGRVLFKD